MVSPPRVALGALVLCAATAYAFWLQGVATACSYEESCPALHAGLVALTYIVFVLGAAVVSFGIRGEEEGAILLIWLYPLALVGLILLQYGIRDGSGFEGPDGAWGLSLAE